MSGLLNPGTQLTTNSGCPVLVENLLGAGGQGEVYRVSVSGTPMALKWYFEHTATNQQRNGLETLAKKGAPGPSFVWPEEMVGDPAGRSFGYIMRLRGKGFRSVVDLVTRRMEPSSRALARAGFELANNFHLLHSKGLCYQDINFDNVFLDPDTGQVEIIDNDNVKVNDPNVPSNILGTMRFMAPEIVTQQGTPGTDSDLFSLSVLLFYMFCVSHPLEGKKEQSLRCLDGPAMTKLYGEEPVFIFDPDDSSNRPVEGVHDNAQAFWDIYPQFLRELFIDAFTKGIKDPIHGRVRESVWKHEMLRLWESILYCPACGSENFYDAARIVSAGHGGGRCWSCESVVPVPYRIRIDKSVVMLNHDGRLLPHHINPGLQADLGADPVAEVQRHKTDPHIWGLRNCTQQKWVATLLDGSTRDVPPGKCVTLANGTKVNFGAVTGEIRG